MSPIDPSQNTQPSLASYFPQIDSSFPNKRARTDDSGESSVQIGNGFINNLTIGNNNTANNNIYLAASDSKLLEKLMLQHIFALQLNTVPLANLDLTIEKLRKEYLRGLQEDNEIKDALSNYVAPEGMGLYDSTRFDLKSKVQDFLNSDKKVLLLLGEAGSGKSTFNRDLAVSLWEAYTQSDKSGDMPIPVFIGLSSLLEPDRNLVNVFFEKQGFSKEQIKELQSKHRFVLILDGFDEIEHRQQVFYKDNELDDWKGSKIIISSRPEYLGPNYQYKFHPPGERNALQEYRLAPFSDDTIKQYIDRYSESHLYAVWSTERYKEALNEPSLKELVSNPFLLKITLSVLPELHQRHKVENQRVTRIAIYDQFVKSWFDRSQQRLNQILEVGSKERKEFKDLEREGFASFGVDFSKELALEMYQVGEVITHYQAVTHARWKKNDTSTEMDWHKRLLSNENTTTVLMRLNAPLICQDRPNNLGKEYRFIHKSLRDYFVARGMWEEFSADKKLKVSSKFNSLNIVNDPAIVQFLSERVKQDAALKESLLRVVESSKAEAEFERGSANAITILVRAGVQFNRRDLQGIRIPGADLSYGVFDSAQLQRADLRGVNLRNIWLRGANVSGAQMSGVEFGEWPYLEEESGVTSCVYSPDGQTCAMGLVNGKISVYQTSNWEKSQTLSGHTKPVRSVAYSPQGDQLASGSEDNTVCLWNIKTGEVCYTLSGHTDSVYSIAYSPQGDQLASGSADNSVRLWEVKTGEAGHVLRNHTISVSSVAYSPQGDQLASGDLDRTVRLWRVKTGELDHTLSGHTDSVYSIAYSPQGDQLASGSLDKIVLLWEVKTGKVRHKLMGHTGFVLKVVYSSQGDQLASGSNDNTVRLWEVKTGAPLRVLSGHTNSVLGIAYSPQGDQLASGSGDKTVRLWEVKTGEVRYELRGHTARVKSVAYSPQGDQLASGSVDNSVRLWMVQSGVPGHILKSYKSSVTSVAYSPQGDQLAAGNQHNAVQLWNVQSGELGYTLEGHTGDVNSVAYSPQGDQLVSGSDDSTVRLWNVQSGELGHTLEGHTGGVNSVAYSPQGDQLVSGSDDSTVRLWNVQSGKLGHTLEGHTGGVRSVAYSPQGDQLASGSTDSTVRLWNVQSGELGHTLRGHTGSVWSVAYSPQGDQLASGSADNTVRLWDVVSGRGQKVIQGFNGSVISVAWKAATEGNYLVTGCEDMLVREWQIIKERNEYEAELCWGSMHTSLTVKETFTLDIQGLSELNQKLLKQRGALLSVEESADEISSEKECSDDSHEVYSTNEFSEEEGRGEGVRI
ncbi:MAG: WD40 repeat [Glomeribacter sp. 1016415]|nr:WD40 repeat [Glomeribacter sp. 1016415]